MSQRIKAEDNLRKAKVQLVIHQPFFASLVLNRRIDIEDIPTAYVTASGRIAVGEKFFAELTVPQCVFVLAHEAMHYAMMHSLRREWRKQRPWNIACDKVINDILVSSGVGQGVPGMAHQSGAEDYASEQLYNEDEGEGEGGGEYAPGQGNDDLSDEGSADVDDKQIEDIKRELIQARTMAKAQGKMPAALESAIDKIVNPRTPWYVLLERYMTGLIQNTISWRRPRRSMLPTGLYLPSVDKTPAMGVVVIQMDESGSIGAEELAHFSGHINKIIETCRPERVVVLHTDTHVGKVEEFSTDDYPLQFRSYCGGGTDMTAGFQWVAENGEEPDVFITLTDGYTPFGTPQTYPVVWLCTTNAVAPHGETIFYEIGGD